MTYQIELTKNAKKKLSRLHPHDQVSVQKSLLELQSNPVFKSQALSGKFYGMRKNRDGKIRIIFSLDDSSQMLIVETIEYRGNAY